MKAKLWCATISLLFLPAFKSSGIPVFDSYKWNKISGDLKTGIAQPMQSMEEVQGFVNKVPYMSDQENYGVAGYWAPPRQFFKRNAGDCEDYAIAKYALGLENGLFARDDARLVEAYDRSRNNTVHMFLIVRGKVYDNQIKAPFDLSSAEARRYDLIGVVDTGFNGKTLALR